MRIDGKENQQNLEHCYYEKWWQTFANNVKIIQHT